MINNKKIYNNLNLLGDLKSSLADNKYISRHPTGSSGSSGIISKKSHTPTNFSNNLMNDKSSGSGSTGLGGKSLKSTLNEKLSFYKLSSDKKKSEYISTDYNSHNTNTNTNHINSNSNKVEDYNSNKIDIKISVNYPTSNPTNVNNVNNSSIQHNKSQSVTQNPRLNSASNYKQELNNNLHLNQTNYNNYINVHNNHLNIGNNSSTSGISHNNTMTKIPNYKESSLDRENLIKNYKSNIDNEKQIRKKIINNSNIDDKSKPYRNKSMANDQKELNISLLNFENKGKYDSGYNNTSSNDINKTAYVKPSNNSYIKNQTVINTSSTNINNTSFGYNPISTDYGQDRTNSINYKKESKLF